MRKIITILTLSLCSFACDSNEQDGRGGNLHDKVDEELATDLKLCTEERDVQDAVNCARDLLSDLEEVSARCGNNPLPDPVPPAPPPVPKCVKKGNSVICPAQTPYEP